LFCSRCNLFSIKLQRLFIQKDKLVAVPFALLPSFFSYVTRIVTLFSDPFELLKELVQKK